MGGLVAFRSGQRHHTIPVQRGVGKNRHIRMVFNTTPPPPYPWYSSGRDRSQERRIWGFLGKTARSGSLGGIQFIPQAVKKMLAHLSAEIILSTERSK